MQVSIYIHIPFCLKKCLYCDFNSFADAKVEREEYVDLLVREMKQRAGELPEPAEVPTLYFGGGTPSLLPVGEVARLIDAAARLFRLGAGAEITLEANPGTVTREKLAGYRAAGVNRLSIGVQSVQDSLLERIGRVHTSAEAVAAVEAARAAGFDNLGIDLIHTLPGETVAMWEDDLRRCVDLAPEHISAYALILEEGTPLHGEAEKGGLVLPEEDVAVAMLELTSDFLVDAGYEHYEISNFAQPGRRSRHNQVYWKRGSYLGFGAGAHSLLRRETGDVRWGNVESLPEYRRRISTGRLPDDERQILSPREAMAEYMFLGLRLLEGVDMREFSREFGATVASVWPGVADGLCRDGLLIEDGPLLRLSRRGLLLANRVFAAFL
ncbi:MAG: radical SAM family heme chaperone HemW [Geobacter sp.]|nr:radical SAM family heme chaperone HemW [Geobacter sp.]